MSQSRYFGRATLALVTSMIAACSSDHPTSPRPASVPLLTAPTIELSRTVFRLCYPGGGSTRVCGSSGYLNIANGGGGTLNWTATKSATWLKVSPRTGTAPSRVKVWVDITGLSRGRTYAAQIRVSAPGATNSPQTATVYMTMR